MHLPSCHPLLDADVTGELLVVLLGCCWMPLLLLVLLVLMMLLVLLRLRRVPYGMSEPHRLHG